MQSCIKPTALYRILTARYRRFIEGQRVLFLPQFRVNPSAPDRISAARSRDLIKGQGVLLTPRCIRIALKLGIDDIKVVVQIIDVYKVGPFRLGQPVILCFGRQTDHPLYA